MAQRNTHLLFLLVSIFVLIGLVVILFFTSPKSEIIISDRISEFIDLVDRSKVAPHNTLVMLDLDDTVLESTQILGTPTWFYNTLNSLRQNGASKLEAFDIMSKADKIVQEKIPVKPIEEATLSAIKYWQKNNMLVMGVSSRPNELDSITQKQISSLNLSFYNDDFACIEKLWQNKLGNFKEGILYVNENSTREEIFDYFFELLVKKCGKKIKLIAQADDQKRYIDQTAKLALKNDVNHVAVIYGKALSERIFDAKKANKELDRLEEMLGFEIIPQKYRGIFQKN